MTAFGGLDSRLRGNDGGEVAPLGRRESVIKGVGE
jgi:hypothetical protein